MWQAEVLQRQGSWCRRFETKDEGVAWAHERINADRESENPVRKISVLNLSKRPKLLPPQMVRKSFDESWKP